MRTNTVLSPRSEETVVRSDLSDVELSDADISDADANEDLLNR